MQKQELITIGRDLEISNLDIESLILYHLHISKNEYFLLDKIDSSENIIADFKRVSEGYPLQYIVKQSEFYGREFYVDNHVLIPRIDTELMIDCIKNKNYGEEIQHLDVGTGSGIIPITLYLEGVTKSSIYAFDISEDALEVCRKNIKKHNLENTIQISKSNLLENFGSLELEKKNKLVITANLPYIKNDDFGNMSESAVIYEPDLALYGGEKTGFEMYERLICECIELQKRGYNIDLFIEIGFDQKSIASEFLGKKHLDFEFHLDSATIERVVEIHF